MPARSLLPLLLAGLVLAGGAVRAQETTQVFRGVTEPRRDLALSLPVGGIVVEVPVTEGASVRAGAPLLRLDARMEELEVRRRELMRSDTARLQATQQRREVAKNQAEGARSLFQQSKAISETELRRAELDYAEAAAAVRTLEADLAKADIEHKIAKLDFERRTLVAPISGTVVGVMVDVGERVRGEEPVVRIIDQSRCVFTVNAEEPFVRDLRVGDARKVEVQLGERWVPVEAKVTFVSPVADAASGLVQVKMEFTNQDAAVRPGLPARVALDRAAH